MKRTKIRKGKDDYLVFAKFCINNSKLKPAEFIKKANEIDLLRDKFSNSVLYNYFLYSKKYFQEGYCCKGMPEKFRSALKVVSKDDCKPAKENIKSKKQLSYEEVITLIEKEEKELTEWLNKIREENSKKIIMLNMMNNDAIEYFNKKMVEIKEKRERLISECLERM